MWGREGIEGRRAEEKGRRREEWRPGGSTWCVKYHVTTGQKNGKKREGLAEVPRSRRGRGSERRSGRSRRGEKRKIRKARMKRALESEGQ